MAANDTIFASAMVLIAKIDRRVNFKSHRHAVCKKGVVINIRKELIKLAQERERGGAVALRFLAAGGSWQASRALEEVRY